ncbi:MAG: hypothetical protein ABSE73_02030 [Planctomycetota bacterium]
MDERPRQTLCALVKQYGPSLCDNPRRCEALLRDACGGCECEILVLMVALHKKVPNALMKRNDSMPWEVSVCLQSERLHGECGLDRNKARWAVESWALALGAITPAQLSTSPLSTGRQQGCSPVAAATSAQLDFFIIPMVTVRLAGIVAVEFMLMVYLFPPIFPPLAGVAVAAGIYMWITEDPHVKRRTLCGWLLHSLSCGMAACGNQACGTCNPGCGDCDCLIILGRRHD